MKTKLFVIAAFVLGLAFASCDSNDPLDPKSKSSSVPALAIAINRKPAAEAKTILLNKSLFELIFIGSIAKICTIRYFSVY